MKSEMQGMSKILWLSAGAIFSTALVGCSGEDGSSCTVEEDGDDAIISCDDGTSVTVSSGADGKDGKNGSDGENGADGEDGRNGVDGEDGKDGTDGNTCSVEDNGDETSTISCSDGTSVTLANSCSVTDNGDGTHTLSCSDETSTVISDGADCTVVDNGDGTHTLSCEDGTSTVISDGEKGDKGDTGAKGDSCSVTDNGNGSVTVSCEDGSSETLTGGVFFAGSGLGVMTLSSSNVFDDTVTLTPPRNGQCLVNVDVSASTSLTATTGGPVVRTHRDGEDDNDWGPYIPRNVPGPGASASFVWDVTADVEYDFGCAILGVSGDFADQSFRCRAAVTCF